MKCNTSKHKKYYTGDFYDSIDEPYIYEYCSKFYWRGNPINYDNAELDNDTYINYKDYENLW